MSKLIYPGLVALLLALTSCEGETTYLKRVENRSNYAMSIAFEAVMTGESDTVYIDPHTSETVYVTYQRGGNDSPHSCLQEMDNITVITEDSLHVTRDITDASNWDQQITSSNKLGNTVQQLCLFVLDDEDFE